MPGKFYIAAMYSDTEIAIASAHDAELAEEMRNHNRWVLYHRDAGPGSPPFDEVERRRDKRIP